jgi:hypothetical protein
LGSVKAGSAIWDRNAMNLYVSDHSGTYLYHRPAAVRFGLLKITPQFGRARKCRSYKIASARVASDIPANRAAAAGRPPKLGVAKDAV